MSPETTGCGQSLPLVSRLVASRGRGISTQPLELPPPPAVSRLPRTHWQVTSRSTANPALVALGLLPRWHWPWV